MFHTLWNYKNGVFHRSHRFQLQLTYSTRLFWCITTTCDQLWVATKYHDLVHLRACLTCLIWDHKGSRGTMTTEYCDSVRCIRDHNGSLDTMATEYNNSLRLIRDQNGSFSRMAIEYYWKNSRNNIVWLMWVFCSPSCTLKQNQWNLKALYQEWF